MWHSETCIANNITCRIRGSSSSVMELGEYTVRDQLENFSRHQMARGADDHQKKRSGIPARRQQQGGKLNSKSLHIPAESPSRDSVQYLSCDDLS